MKPTPIIKFCHNNTFYALHFGEFNHSVVLLDRQGFPTTRIIPSKGCLVEAINELSKHQLGKRQYKKIKESVEGILLLLIPDPVKRLEALNALERQVLRKEKNA